MISRLLFLIIGIVIGFFLFNVNQNVSETIKEKISDLKSEKIENEKEAPSISSIKKNISALPNLASLQAKIEEEKKIPKQEHILRFDEEKISEIEKLGQNKRDLAYTKKIENGWEIYLLKDNSLITEMGFQNGDIISRSSLDELNYELKDRFLALFTQLER